MSFPSRVLALAASAVFLSCSNAGDSLTGSLSTVYDLSFNSITLELENGQNSSVLIKYVGSNGDPAVLVVDISNLESVPNVSINLTSPDPATNTPRGVLYNVGTVMTELDIQTGTVVFDNTPQVGHSLSGHFSATLSQPVGLTVNGTFSGPVSAP